MKGEPMRLIRIEHLGISEGGMVVMPWIMEEPLRPIMNERII
jgi:hypothetical protein